MAIAKEKLQEIMNSEGELSSKLDLIIALADEDTNTQLNAIKVNKEEILNEKREEAAKRKAIEEQLKEMKEKSLQLEEQLKAASPEEVQKIYDQKMSEAANIHAQREADLQNTIDAYKSRINDLEHSQLKLECMEAFNKAVAGKNIATDALQDFSDFVLGPDCYKFSHRPVGDGKTILATKEGITIDAAVNAALGTNFGKRCVVSANSGGSAEGGVRDSGSTINPFKKETWNLSEQGRLFREDPDKYKRLKAQAGL